MRDSKKDSNKAPSTKAGQALPGRILVAEDNKALGNIQAIFKAPSKECWIQDKENHEIKHKGRGRRQVA